jgi:hypothetical protein
MAVDMICHWRRESCPPLQLPEESKESRMEAHQRKWDDIFSML